MYTVQYMKKVTQTCLLKGVMKYRYTSTGTEMRICHDCFCCITVSLCRAKDVNVKYPGTCVADLDPYVFGPPGSESGSISQSYGYGSRSFYHQAKIVRKT